MEKVKMTKNSPKYGFKKGDEFIVKRNIRNECVIIMDDKNTPNLILSEHEFCHTSKTLINQKKVAKPYLKVYNGNCLKQLYANLYTYT